MKSCNGVVPISSGFCSACGKQKSSSLIQEAEKLKTQIKITGEYSPELYKQAKGLLHPYDCDFMKILKFAWNDFDGQKSQNHAIGLEICELTMINLLWSYPQILPRIGFEKIKMANSCAMLSKIEKAKKLIEEAKILFEICFAKSHPIMEIFQKSS